MILDALISIALSQEPTAQLTAGVRENVFGIEAVGVIEDERHGIGGNATVGHTFNWCRMSLGVGRCWWDAPRENNGSKVEYSALLRMSLKSNVVIQYQHYSTGYELFGEQADKVNHTYDGLHIGYCWEF